MAKDEVSPRTGRPPGACRAEPALKAKSKAKSKAKPASEAPPEGPAPPKASPVSPGPQPYPMGGPGASGRGPDS